MSEAPPPHAHPELADPRARPLNDAEVEALAALRPLVGPVEADEKSDDAALLRFLRARRLNVAQAHEMHKKWVQWRKDFKVDQLNIANFKREIASGKAFWFGYDKMKRPCLFILPRYHRPSKARFQQTIQHGVWLVEEGVRRAEALGSTQICVVYDREGMTSSNRDPQILQLGKNLTGMLQDNYAERLGAYYILNVNWFFWLMHKIISPLLSEETRAKIKILRAPSATDHPLLEFFDADQLPREYGGTADFKYNPRDILGNLLDDDEKEDKLVEGNTVFSLEDSVSVRALGSFELPAEINERVLAPLDAQSKPGAVCAVRVSWSFTTVKGDISFAVNFTPNLIAGTGDAEPLPAQTDAPESEPIVEPARVEAHLKPIEGSCVLRNPGKLQFVWDNRFSLFTAKQLKYSVRCMELLEPQPQQTAE